MLGPIAGGLIVGYLHWRVIFFPNIPIGLTGLILVYLHLPDYREDQTPPLDVVGLILFGSVENSLLYLIPQLLTSTSIPTVMIRSAAF